jgi:hypothetical protein
MDIRVPSLAALARAYGSTARRRTLIRKLRRVLAELRSRGFEGDVFVGGSFITSKPEPGDVDVVLDCAAMVGLRWASFARAVLGERARWDAIGVDVNLAHPDIPRGGVLALFRQAGALAVLTG